MQNDKVQLLITNSFFSSSDYELITTELALERIQSGFFNSDFISKARILNKKDPDYSTLKGKSKQICWGYNTLTEKFSGYVYFDVDLKSEDNPEFTKRLLFELPYVKAVWSSFGGSGIGGLIYCNSITSKEDYKLAYKSIAISINKKVGVEIDPKCSNYNRNNTLSSDPNLLSRKTPQIFCDFIFEVEKGKSKVGFSNYEIDSNLKIDLSLLNKINDIFEKDVYIKYLIINNLNNLPVEFSEKINFNFEEYRLEQFVDNFQVEEQNIKNNRNTLAYNSNGYSCFKINLPANSYFPKGKRAKSLISIILNLICTNSLRKFEFDKNLIFNLLLVLNSKCVLKKPIDKSEQVILCGLDETELNRISTFIYQKICNKEVNLLVQECKSIRTIDFVQYWLKDNPEYKGDTHPRSIILKQIKDLKSKTKTIDLCELFDLYPNLKNQEYIQILQVEHSLTFAYAKKMFYKLKKELPMC